MIYMKKIKPLIGHEYFHTERECHAAKQRFLFYGSRLIFPNFRIQPKWSRRTNERHVRLFDKRNVVERTSVCSVDILK